MLIRAEQHEALEYLLALFDGLSSGNGRVVLVSGTLGSGKTQLLHDFSALAAKEGALVLQATGSRAERDLPMGVVEQLLRCAELPSELAAEIPGLVAEAFGDHPGSGPRFERPRAVENETIRRLCNVLLGACDGRPVVVGIDDVHFADAASLQALLYLQRRMRPQRMLMVLNEWDRPQPTLPMFRAEVTRAPHSRIRLKSMSERTIRDILERTADHGIEPRLAPAVHRLSGGNPILVHALIEDNHFDHDHDDHADAGRGRARTDDAPHVGRSFEMAVLACLYRWEPQILSVASGMAVLREHASPALLGRLLDLDRRCVGQALEILTNAGLANGDEFRHPNVAAAVLASLSPEERTALYTRATRLRRELGMATTDIAAQIVAAGEAGGDWTVPILTDAAEQELASGKTSTAHLYLNLALAAANDDQHLATLRTYVRSTWQTNPSAVAPHTTALREALVEGKLTGRDVVALIRALLWRGDLTTVSAVLAEAGHADLTLGHEDGAELLHVFHWFFGPSFTRSWNLDELCGAGGADGAAGGGARPTTAAEAVDVFSRAWSRGGDAESVSLAERVLSSCRVDEMPLEAITTAILALADGDQTGRALLWCDELIGHATRRGATTWLAQLKAARADVCLRGGDPGAAAELASDALSLAGEENWGVSIGYPLSVLIQAHLALGRMDDAAKEAGREVPSAMFETVMGIRYLHARGRLALAAGRTREALDDLRTCARRLRVWQLDVSALIPLTASLVEATFQAGDPEAARALAAGRLEEPSLDDRTRDVLLRILADHDGGPGRAEPAMSRRVVDGLRASDGRRASDDRLEPARAEARPDVESGARSRRVRTGFVPAAEHERPGLGDGFGYDEEPYAGGAAHLGADRPTGAGLGDEDGLRDGHGLPADGGPRDDVPRVAVPRDDVPRVSVSQVSVSHVAVPHGGGETALLLGPSPATAPGAASCSVLTGLSRAELRVARLAAQGDSNREISDKLWITVSTVEQHLTRIYRKLNLSGRAGLAGLLRAELLPADAPVFRDTPGGSTRIGPEVGFHAVELVGCAASSVEALEAVADAAGLGADGVAVG